MRFIGLPLLLSCATTTTIKADDRSAGDHAESGLPSDTSADADTDSDDDTDSDADADADADTGAHIEATVCGDGIAAFSDIQEAIDAAADGDTITVCAGTYGPIYFENRHLALIGVDGAAVTTISHHRWDAVAIAYGEVSMRGFTIRDDGYGIISISGAVVDLADLILSDCAPGSTMIGTSSSDVVMDDITVSNVVSASPEGILMAFIGPGTVALSHVRVQNSVSARGLHAFDVRLEVANTIWNGNSFGGRLWSFGGTTDIIARNNVIFGNVSPTDPDGRLFELSKATVFDGNIVAENSVEGELFERETSMTGNFNDVWNNAAKAVSEGHGELQGTGNLKADPTFADAAGGDFTLLPGSPAIDQGNPDSAYDDPDGTRNDMGAFGGPNGGRW